MAPAPDADEGEQFGVRKAPKFDRLVCVVRKKLSFPEDKSSKP